MRLASNALFAVSTQQTRLYQFLFFVRSHHTAPFKLIDVFAFLFLGHETFRDWCDLLPWFGMTLLHLLMPCKRLNEVIPCEGCVLCESQGSSYNRNASAVRKRVYVRISPRCLRLFKAVWQTTGAPGKEASLQNVWQRCPLLQAQSWSHLFDSNLTRGVSPFVYVSQEKFHDSNSFSYTRASKLRPAGQIPPPKTFSQWWKNNIFTKHMLFW